MVLERLALSRSTLDRAAHLRSDPGLLPRLAADPATLVLPMLGTRAPVHQADGDVRLALALASEPAGLGGVPAGAPLVIYLGEDAAGTSYLAAAWPEPPGDGQGAGPENPSANGSRSQPPPLPPGARLATLREAGSLLDDTGAGLLTTAVALAGWHAAHPRCSRCGAATDVDQSGWTRRCPRCGAEHFPRTDPAVIMSVVDDGGRILLGHQASWPPGRFSTLAGFVEPGESLEAAVRREVAEESGVVVGDVTYRGSQPWPFPSSLMLGFRARAVTTEVTADGVELAEARWWSRDELVADLASGELLLPPRVSIARRLVEDWFGGPIDTGADAWR